MRTHGGLTEDSRTRSLITPIRKGREGNRKGREGNATAIWSLADGEEIALHRKSLTGPARCNARGRR